MVATTVEKLKQTQGLWDNNIPNMIAAYFADMELILKLLRAKLKPSGRAYLIVGDSKYAGVEVPVAAALVELSPPLGYTLNTRNHSDQCVRHPSKEVAQSLMRPYRLDGGLRGNVTASISPFLGRLIDRKRRARTAVTWMGFWLARRGVTSCDGGFATS